MLLWSLWVFFAIFIIISVKMSGQNSETRENFVVDAWVTTFSLTWTVKLLFVVFGRLSYTFFEKKICNLSVQPVYLTEWRERKCISWNFLKIRRNKISINERLNQRCQRTTGSNFWKSKSFWHYNVKETTKPT